jgi:hypothetical protein
MNKGDKGVSIGLTLMIQKEEKQTDADPFRHFRHFRHFKQTTFSRERHQGKSNYTQRNLHAQ